MIITPIKTSLYANRTPIFQQKSFKNYHLPKDIVSFKSALTIGCLPNDITVDLEHLNENSNGVIAVNDTGYLAQIFKYKPHNSNNIYAIKKVWPDDLAKHISANPLEQLKTEAQVYERLKGIKNIPEFYFYKGTISTSPKTRENNYIVMQWVDGEQASLKGTFYNSDLITKDKLKKIYNLLLEFDKRGVLHNDLWAGNILFTKNDVNLIDFNRSRFFDPISSPKTNNLDSFKERFLNRYLSDVYQQSGEEELVDLYKNTQLFEADFLEKKAKFFNSNGLKDEAQELFKQKEIVKQSIKDQNKLKEKALLEVINTDLRCGKIYAKYFEFEDGETQECYNRLRKTISATNNIGNINPININYNIQIIDMLKQTINSINNKNIESSLSTYKKIRQKLLNPKAYPQSEREEMYYQKFSKFCDINIEILSSLATNDKQKAEFLLQNNKDFFYQTKRIIPYYEKLKSLLE